MYSTCIRIIIVGLFGLSQLTAQQACKLEFNGDWAMKSHFEAFEGFTTNYAPIAFPEMKLTDGSINLTFEDVLNGNPDPTPEQIATYEFICENPDLINSILVDSSRFYFAEYLEEVFNGGMTDLTEEEVRHTDPINLAQLMTPLKLYIHIESKDGYAYYGIGGHCIWEMDEGFGYILHRNRILDADVSFVTNEKDAIQKENGTYKTWKLDGVVYSKKMIERGFHKTLEQPGGVIIPPEPQRYAAHPKYGKLKPLEEAANASYVTDLIKQGYWEEVKELHQEEEFELSTARLQDAVQYNQKELIKYFLSRETEWDSDMSGVLHKATSNLNKETTQLLLDHGFEINEVYHRYTPLGIVGHRQYSPPRIKTRVSADEEEFKTWLISKGAKTTIELYTDLIEKDDYAGIDKLVESVTTKNLSITSSPFHWDNFIRKTLDEGKVKMAVFLFSKYLQNREKINPYQIDRLMDKSFELGSLDLVKYLISQVVDVNELRTCGQETHLDRLSKYLKWEDHRFENLKQIELYLLSLGARTFEDLVFDLFNTRGIDELRSMSEARKLICFGSYENIKKYVTLAIRVNKYELAQEILEEMPAPRYRRLHLAIELMDKRLVEYCLSSGLKLIAMDVYAAPLDHLPYDNNSLEPGKYEAFKSWLVAKGAKTKQQLVFELIESSKLDSLKSLVENLNFSISSIQDLLPYIDYAFEKEELDIAEYYLEFIDDKTRLFEMAVYEERKALVSSMLSEGYELNKISKNRTALDYYGRKANSRYENVRISAKPFHEWLQSQGALTSMKILEQLLQQNQDDKILSMFDDEQFVLVHNRYVAGFLKKILRSGHKELALKIFSRNNYKNKNLILQFALDCYSIEFVEHCLAEGAEINYVDFMNETPLSRLKRMSEGLKGQDKEEAAALYEWMVGQGAVLAEVQTDKN